MDKLYDEKNKKDKFIFDILLPKTIERINDVKDEKRKELLDLVSSMNIFPYITEDGIRLGNLIEPGVSWYFENSDKSHISAGSYRIISNSVLGEEKSREFRQTFGEDLQIEQFSNDAVIKDIIIQMRNETSYSDAWWKYAYDILKIWNSEESNINLSTANESINSNGFLFYDIKYQEIKDELIESNIVYDIEDTANAKEYFWNKISAEEFDKARFLLKELGVPTNFTKDNEVRAFLKEFFRSVGELHKLEIDSDSEDWDKYNLCNKLVFEYIYNESSDAFYALLETQDLVAGIPIKNVYGNYVTLDMDLFYQSEVTTSELPIYEHKLDFLQIESSTIDTYNISSISSVHRFEDVTGTFEEYFLGIENIEPIEFYKWIWDYSQHKELANNICSYIENNQELIESNKEFILSVLASYEEENSDYTFDIIISIDEASKYVSYINKGMKIHCYIAFIVSGNMNNHQVKELLPQLLNSLGGDSEEFEKIKEDYVWENFYICSDLKLENENVLICNNNQKEFILVSNKSDSESILKAMASYVKLFYNVTTNLLESIYWKEEYLQLSKKIMEFISYEQDKIADDDTSFKTSDLSDLSSYGEEKRLWHQLELDQKRILSLDEESSLGITVDRSFLLLKYFGRCQLCHCQTVTKEQYSHFFTYRIVKEKENKLANYASNMLCLCPTCHGELGYGAYMGQNLSELKNATKKYFDYYKQITTEQNLADDNAPIIEEIREYLDNKRESHEEIPGFNNAVVCPVLVNGKQREMVFSYEHFVRLTHILWSEK